MSKEMTRSAAMVAMASTATNHSTARSAAPRRRGWGLAIVKHIMVKGFRLGLIRCPEDGQAPHRVFGQEC